MGRGEWRRVFGLLTGMALLGGGPTDGAAQGPLLTFRSTAPEFEGATEEYRAIWREDGARIVSALRARSGMRFPVDAVDVRVMESASWAGTDEMGMRATTTPGWTSGEGSSPTVRWPWRAVAEASWTTRGSGGRCCR